MEWYVHPDAVEEFLGLSDDSRAAIKENVTSRMERDTGITGQRGVGISYDSHGTPLSYFKVEEVDYRVFFDILDGDLVLLGFRPRDEDTYIDLRQFTNRAGR